MGGRPATIGDKAADLDASLFVGRTEELAVARTWLASPEDTPFVLGVSGFGGVGKSALLEQCARQAKDLGRDVVWADGYKLSPYPEALMKALTGDPRIQAGIDCINRDRPLVIIDTLDAMQDLARFFAETFIPALSPEVKLAVASRSALGRSWSGSLPFQHFVQRLHLDALSLAEAEDYLTRRGILDPRLRDQITRAAQGLPLALSMAADLVDQFAITDLTSAAEWSLARRSVVERLLRYVPDPELRRLLEAASTLRHFDEPTLSAVAGSTDIGPAFDGLCRLSFVRPTENGLALHQDVRTILAEDLRWRNPERYRQLTTRRFSYYRDRALSSFGEEREWLVAERLHLWAEALGHLVLDPGDSMTDLSIHPAGTDPDELLDIWRGWLRNFAQPTDALGRPRYDVERAVEWARSWLTHPSSGVRVVRDGQDQALGFSTVVPATRSSYRRLTRDPVVGRTLRAYLHDEATALPADLDKAGIFQILHLAHRSASRASAIRAALIRDLFGLFAREGTYFSIAPSASWRRVLLSLGFRPISVPPTGDGSDTKNLVLDLTDIGVERWIEHLISDRPLPRSLASGLIEGDLHGALAHWSDDQYLGRSALVDLLDHVPDLTAERAAAVRDMVIRALERARTSARPDEALAYQAIELGYLSRNGSHERTAERMHVSRTTFYRLLTRGTRALARSLAEDG